MKAHLSFASLAVAAGSIVLAACSGGGGGNPAPAAPGGPTASGATPVPTASHPGATATPANRASGTPSASPTPTAAPSTLPASFATGVPCEAGSPSPIPGLYTSVTSYGNVTGNTYTQDDDTMNLTGNYYAVDLLFTPPPASPKPGPSYSPIPTAPPPSPIPTSTFPTPSVSPTVTPTPLYEQYTTYVGTYSIPSFQFAYNGTTYATNTSPGCAQIQLIQPVGGTAGMAQRRRAIDSFDGDNTMAFGSVPFATYGYGFEEVDSGTLTSMTITNLTPTTGNATFTLDNGTTGTMTITGSVTAIVPQAGFARRAGF